MFKEIWEFYKWLWTDADYWTWLLIMTPIGISIGILFGFLFT